jgi:CRISPR/Cas system endoribonuclease Cas6 (RAMP superfamily)
MMLYGNYNFRCRFESEAHLPIYKGSTFRGIFGRALKQVVCALRRQECPTCLLKSECLYPLVFEPQLTVEQTEDRHKAPLPHPFVIQPPLNKKTLYAQGAPFDFNLVLFGAVNTRLPYFVYALDQMGKIGVGKKVIGRRAKFSLETVHCKGQKIYQKQDQKLSNDLPAHHLKISRKTKKQKQAQTITLNFTTPLRIKHKNQLSPDLPFHVLVRAMLRRASSLLTAYDSGEPDLDYSGMVQRAHAIKIKHTNMEWVDWRRYSFRQDQAMLIGGLKGAVTYTGNLSEYLPLIDFCTQVNVGKQTTFGLGRFIVEDLT